MGARITIALFAAVSASLATGAAKATEWIYCGDADAEVEIGFLLGSIDAFMPAGATMRHRTMHWTTNEAYGDGQIFTVGQGFMDQAGLAADLYDEAVNQRVAELRLSRAEEGQDVVYAGTLRIIGQGVWPVSCDPG